MSHISIKYDQTHGAAEEADKQVGLGWTLINHTC